MQLPNEFPINNWQMKNNSQSNEMNIDYKINVKTYKNSKKVLILEHYSYDRDT